MSETAGDDLQVETARNGPTDTPIGGRARASRAGRPEPAPDRPLRRCRRAGDLGLLPYGPFEDEAALAAQLEANAASEDPLFYAIIDLRDGRAGGVASYLRITPEHGVIEIGHIWLGLGLQRTREATEAIFLLARHAFDDLGYRRFEWKCNAANAASRSAAERFGFTFEGIFRQHQIVKGRNRDTAWYAILDHEWPAIRASFEAWLDDANFDEAGHQRRRLSEFRNARL